MTVGVGSAFGNYLKKPLGKGNSVSSLAHMSEEPFLRMSQILATVEPAHLGPNPRRCALGESEIRARAAELLSVGSLPAIRQDLVLALLLL